jgi:hypothetical protein
LAHSQTQQQATESISAVHRSESGKPVRGPQSIINPWVDFLCVGGLSIAVMAGVLVYLAIVGVKEDGGAINFGSLLVMQALINWPHFMASYRLLYVPTENIARYPFSAIYVPGALFLFVVACLDFGDGGYSVPTVNQHLSYYLWLGAAFYLAWHYTGQAWGMVASFAFLAGIKIDDTERILIRTGLRILLAWHVVWGAQDLPAHWLGPLHPHIPMLLDAVSIAAVLAFFVGAGMFIRIKRRTGMNPTPQMIAPWLAIYLWYLVLNFEPDAYMLVQLSHALQYLIFPLRVELNRLPPGSDTTAALGKMLWAGRYYTLLLVVGGVIFYLPTLLPGSSQTFTLAVVIASAVSIHHYFVDGTIWKISNKEVRAKLFSHLEPT